MAQSLSQITIGNQEIIVADDAPDVSGLAAEIGSIASVPGVGVYVKALAGDFDWVKLITTASESYTHTQTVPADIWTVTHNLGKRVSVSVTDSTDQAIVAQITWIDDNTVQVDFNGLMTGYVYCN